MEERVKRLERDNRILFMGLFLLILIIGGSKIREFFKGGEWFYGKGVVTENLTTNMINVMELNASQPTPRVILLSTDTSTTLSFIDSTRNAILGIGIEKTPDWAKSPPSAFKPKQDYKSWSQTKRGKLRGLHDNARLASGCLASASSAFFTAFWKVETQRRRRQQHKDEVHEGDKRSQNAKSQHMNRCKDEENDENPSPSPQQADYEKTLPGKPSCSNGIVWNEGQIP